MLEWFKLFMLSRHAQQQEKQFEDYWEQQFREQKERHVREIFAHIGAAGCIITDESTVDGIRYGDLQK